MKGYAVLAHRAGPATGIENTLEALRRCRDEGADAVELDVRLTADGEPVVFHDPDGRRLAGIALKVRDVRWGEVGSWRVRGRHRVMHLEEALRAVEDWPGAELFVDLHERSLALAETVAATVSASSAAARVLILAFHRDRALLAAVRRAAPGARLAVMPGAPWNIAPSLTLRPEALCLGWDGAATRVLYRLASALWDIPGALEPARSAGVALSAGIANSEADIAWLAAQGFARFWTDDVPLARRVLERL
ncbi:MAG: hypothetical protein HY553_10310 [Elusimicrobia bacterium]|nr:hypothetical protein [Elusimicrobiota bacterium]